MLCTAVSFAPEADGTTVRGTIGPVMHNQKASTAHFQQVSLVTGASPRQVPPSTCSHKHHNKHALLTAMTSHVMCIGQILFGLQAFKAAVAQGKWSLRCLLALEEQQFRSGPPQQ